MLYNLRNKTQNRQHGESTFLTVTLLNFLGERAETYWKSSKFASKTFKK